VSEEVLQRLAHQFDKEPTPAIIAFEIVVLLGTVALLWLLSRRQHNILKHYLVVAVGVLIFEVFTAPMWDNHKLGVWAYLYKDVSWVLTLGWSSLVLGTVFLVDWWSANARAWQRFLVYLGILTVLTAVAEAVVVGLGIRSYAPEIMAVLAGSYIPGTPISLHLLYYVPVFLSLVICVYKYWAPLLDGTPIPEPTGQNWLRSLALGFVGVFFFELMIEPMVDNRGFPSWSYVYRDISVLMTGFWLALIVLTTNFIDRLLPRLDAVYRFALYLVVLCIVATPIEGWLINSGMRMYGPSATANFSGIRTMLGDLPIEVVAAIPLYLALVICFIRYWERITAPDLQLGFSAPALAPTAEAAGS